MNTPADTALPDTPRAPSGPGEAAPAPFAAAAAAPAVADAVAQARAAHFALPQGWQPCPVERRPLYSGARCPDPVRGYLIARDPGLRYYVLRTTLATRAWGFSDRLIEVPVNDEIVLLEDLDLGRLAPFLARPDVYVEIDVRDPVVVERRAIGGDVYGYTITANPAMLPRAALPPRGVR